MEKSGIVLFSPLKRLFLYYLSAVFCCCLIIPAGVNHSIIKGSIHHSPFEAVFESRHFDADIPKGAEVIDVCKAVEEMMNESEERGELRMLIDNICTFCAKALFLELCVYYKTLAGKLHPRTC